MNSTEWLPQDHYLYTMPKSMVPYCRYIQGKMSAKGAATIIGPVSHVREM